MVEKYTSIRTVLINFASTKNSNQRNTLNRNYFSHCHVCIDSNLKMKIFASKDEMTVSEFVHKVKERLKTIN